MSTINYLSKAVSLEQNGTESKGAMMCPSPHSC